ncbi:LPXTG cell wall anchor domain-containing protein [Listeria monocytogenes]|nr:LPXTG cell wall anchor domain-containing protein [Listeria monocytogenes]HAA2890275.1 internalin [Listeria monocytogenes]HAB9004753.1 LPXTG cell wall anchor domain-containing protein [Listeria monocytogenes]
MNSKHAPIAPFLCMLTLVLSICLWIGTSHSTEVQADVITQPTAINQLFPDAALAEVMRGELGKTSVTDTVSQSELDQLTFISIVNDNIQSVEGLQYVNQLSFLGMPHNQISDLTPLKSLTGLESLYLEDNQISDLTPLKSLTGLEFLYLGVNQISDLTPLKSLTGLESLALDINQISDLTPLKSLTGLETLYLEDNQISDLTPLASLTGLEYLTLGVNQINDLSPLTSLTRLESLSLDDNQISDLTPLKSLTGLRYLTVTNQQIKETPVSYTPNLVLPNEVKDATGALIPPATISNNGTYVSPNLTWELPNYLAEVKYTFNQSVTIGQTSAPFTGTVTQPLQEVPVVYTVTLNVDGTETQEDVAVDALVPEPTEPTKEGYTFMGWFDAKTGGTQWDFATDKMPANDVTLYARFTKQSTPSVDPETPHQGSGTDTGSPTGQSQLDGNSSKRALTLVESEGTKTTSLALPKTGDEPQVFPIILGILCLGLASFLGFRRTHIK